MIADKMKDLVASSSVIRAMFEEGIRLSAIHGKENVFDFSLGNPSSKVPEAVKKAAMSILEQDEPDIHAYMPNSGFPVVRRKIADHINANHGTDFNDECIVMTVGAAGALNVIFKAIINPGDEVIVFAPFFGEYRNYTANYGAQTVIVPPNIENFQPDLEKFEQALTPKTKAVIINSPNNPSGAVYSHETLTQIADILKRYQKTNNTVIYLISDEPYREIAYNNVEIPYVSKYYENSFVAYSYSKSLSLPGERIGYIAINPKVVDFEELSVALNVANRILGYVNAPSLFQKVIAECVDVKTDISGYEKNMNLLYDALTQMGIKCVKPQGAFYLFPRSPEPNDAEFCKKAKEYNILIVPGSAFACPGHFRMAYCVPYEQCVNSLKAFEKLMANYK